MKKLLKLTTMSFSMAVAGTVSSILLKEKYKTYKAEQNNTPTLDHTIEFAQLKCGKVGYKVLGYGKPLVLLHDFHIGASHKEWSLVQEKLAEHFEVFAIDFIGFGNSEKPNSLWSAYQYAQFLQEFLETVVKVPAYVIGSNGGADIALVHSLFSTEYMKKAIFISPTGFEKGFASQEDVSDLSKQMSPVMGTSLYLNATTTEEIQKTMQPKFYNTEKLTPEMIEDMKMMCHIGKHSQTTFASLEAHFWGADTKKAFSNLNIPYALFWGEDNQENPISNFETSKTERPEGYYCGFEQIGAYPHIENPTGFLSIVEDFFLS